MKLVNWVQRHRLVKQVMWNSRYKNRNTIIDIHIFTLMSEVNVKSKVSEANYLSSVSELSDVPSSTCVNVT